MKEKKKKSTRKLQKGVKYNETHYGHKIDWEYYRAEWIKFKGNKYEFSQKYNIKYRTVRNKLRDRELKEIKQQTKKIISETIQKRITIDAVQKGMKIADIYIKQNNSIKIIEKLEKMLKKKMRELAKKGNDKEGKSLLTLQNLKDLSEINQKNINAMKTVLEFFGKNIKLSGQIDSRIQIMQNRSEELANMVMSEAEVITED